MQSFLRSNGIHLRRMRQYGISFLLILLWSACSSASEHTIKPILHEIPIYIGDSQVHEFAVSKNNVPNASWRASNLQLDKNGLLSGEFQVEYDGYLEENPLALGSVDVLLFVMSADYIYPQMGDLSTIEIGDVKYVIATEATLRSAKFSVREHFPVPELILNRDGGLPLHAVNLYLAWYRVQKEPELMEFKYDPNFVYPIHYAFYGFASSGVEVPYTSPIIYFGQPAQQLNGFFTSVTNYPFDFVELENFVKQKTGL